MNFFSITPRRSRVSVLLLLSLGCLFASAVPAQEEPVRPKLRRMFSHASDLYPIEIRSPDSTVLAGLLQTADDSYKIFLERMGLKELENFRLILEVNESAADGQLRSFDSFPRKMRRTGDEIRFRVLVDGPVGKREEQVYRSCMICYLQYLELKTGIPSTLYALPDPPFWLSEGLTQIALKSRVETCADIVRRYQRLERMPELKTVQEWKQASDHTIEAFWQQSFALALVRLTTVQAAEKQAVVLWLTSGAALSGLYVEPTQRNEAWWRVSAATPRRSFTYYDWDKTVASLNEVLQVGLTARGEHESRVLSIADLPDSSQVVSTAPLNSKVEELTLLRQSVHVMWVPVVELYRMAVVAWLQSDKRTYADAVGKAALIEKSMGRYMEQVRDYLDYVTVNYPVDKPESSYLSYRDMLESLQNSRLSLRTPVRPVTTGKE